MKLLLALSLLFSQLAFAANPVSFPSANATRLSYYVNAAASGSTGTETAITLSKASNAAAVTTGTGFVIPAGKRFHITALSVATRGHATGTAQSTVFNLRWAAAGSCGTTSTPILAAIQSATAAVSLAWDRVLISPFEGFDIAGDGVGAWCITAAATFTTNAPTWSVNVFGYEY